MRKLYEIFSNLESVYSAMESAESDADYEAALNEFENAKLELDDKLENICSFIKNLQSESEVFAAESKRLNEISKQQSAKVEKLKEFLAKFIPAGHNWARGVHKIGWRKSEAIVTCEMLPDEYIRTKIITEPDKLKIKDALKADPDLEIPGAWIERRNNIQVK